jgi:hypothetical protein
MPKRGCLNCHFFVRYGISIKSGAPFEEAAEPEFRTRESLDGMLKSLSRALRSPWSIKCSRGKWDSERIGNKNTDEIRNAILSPERDTCDCFSELNKYADQEAVKESEKKKDMEKEMRITRRLSVLAIVIAFIGTLISLGSLVVAYLAYLEN